MKKHFIKQLTCVLSVAIAVPAAVPAAISASAAAKQSLNATKKILYVGKSFDFGVRNNDTKNYTYAWSTSNKNIVSVNTRTGLATAKKGGKATITVKITNKKTKKASSLKAAIEVRTVLKSISITNPASGNLQAGRSYNLTANFMPTDATFKDITWKSSDSSVAAIDPKTGILTAQKTGNVTITAQSTIYNKIKSQMNLQIVDAVPALLTVSQVAATKVAALFDLNINQTFTASDFKIMNEATKQEFPIKSASVDTTDKKKVNIETYAELVGGTSYTLIYKDKKLPFTVTDGVVASIEITPLTVPYNTATELKVLEKDAKGIIISEQKLGNINDSKLEFTVDSNYGYVDGSKLTLYNKGDTAKAKAVYHTYKYDNFGNEIGALTREVTITAVEQSPVNVKAYKYTIGDKPSNWDSVSLNSKIALNDTKTLYLYVKNSDDTIAEDGYTLESSNSDVLLVADNNNLSANVMAVNQGTAYVLVKKDGRVVWSLPVTIVAERKATSLAVSRTNVELSNTSAIMDSQIVEVKAKDQYGNELNALNSSEISVQCIGVSSTSSQNKKDDVVEGIHYNIEDGKVIFRNAQGQVKTGVYTYKISVGDKSAIVTVNVKNINTNATPTYNLVIDSKADVKFNSSNKEPKTITIRVAEKLGGVLYRYVDCDAVVKHDGNIVQIDKENDPSGTVLKFKALQIDGSTVTKAPAGSYNVSVNYTSRNGTKSFNSVFQITDSQSTQVTFKRIYNTIDAVSDPVSAVQKAFEFYYNGKTYSEEKGNLTVVATDHTKLNSNGYHIKKVTLLVTENVDGTEYSVPVTVSVGQTVMMR